MKVALVSNFPVYSGTGKVPYRLWQALKTAKLVEADYFLTHFLTAADHFLPEYRSVHVLQPFDYMRSPTLSRLYLYFVEPYRLPKGYDLYHLGNHMIARFAAFRRPAVVTVHDVLQFKYPESFENPLTAKIYNHFMLQSIRNLGRADHLICVSRWSKDEVLRQFPNLSQQKVSVVYNGLDHQLFSPRDKRQSRQKLGFPQEKKIILNLGSEIPRKQIPLLLKSFAEVKKQESQAILLRHGEETSASRNLIRELGLPSDVWYRGNSLEASLPDYYAAADLLVVTSSEEGFCLPVVEAMACGLPVVITNLTSLPEIAGGAQADTIKELKVNAVAEAICRALKMTEKELGAVRRRGIENATRFSWEKAARETYEIYNQVLAKNKSKIGNIKS